MIDPQVVLRVSGARRSRVLVRQLGPGRDPQPHDAADSYDLVEAYFDASQLAQVQSEDLTHADAIVFDREPTRRKLAAVKWLSQHTDVLSGYETLCLADDDVTPVKSWNEVFEAFELTHALVGQPALTRDSYHSHEVTRQVPGLLYRWTDFIEVMVPMFCREAFDRVVDVMDVTRSGWSVDDAWMHVLHEGVILDCAPVVHDRPIGATYAVGEAAAESQAWLRASGTPMTRKITLRHGPRAPGVPVDACHACMVRRAEIMQGTVILCRVCAGTMVLRAMGIDARSET